MKIGYARVSTADQDLEAQIDQLKRLGVDPKHIYSDHGFTGRNRQRPGLDNALQALRAGDMFVVTKLDRLARSLTDAQSIFKDIEDRGAVLTFGGTTYDPRDPMGKMMFSMLGVFSEFESDLIRQRTKEGLAVAKKNGRLKGKQHRLSIGQAKLMVKLYDTEDSTYTIEQLAQEFKVGRATVYRTLERGRQALSPQPKRPSDLK